MRYRVSYNDAEGDHTAESTEMVSNLTRHVGFKGWITKPIEQWKWQQGRTFHSNARL
jgi:hypothetical protein